MISDEHKKKMAQARKEALVKGRYVEAYEKKSRRMKGKPHGYDKKIAAAHRAKKSAHPSARHHSLIAPDGTVHEFDNAEFFIRSNPELFLPEDRIERKKPNGKIFTRAGNGLQAVSNGSKRQWKGWEPSPNK